MSSGKVRDCSDDCVSQCPTGDVTGTTAILRSEERISDLDGTADGCRRHTRVSSVHDHDRYHRRPATGLDCGGVPAHDRIACRELVALGRNQLETIAVELDGVDAQVDEHALTRCGEHDECVRVELEESSGDRRDGGARMAIWIDRDARADDLLGEDRVGHVGQGDDRAGHRCDRAEGVGHSMSSMSLAMVSASGPTTTCTTLPDTTTP